MQFVMLLHDCIWKYVMSEKAMLLETSLELDSESHFFLAFKILSKMLFCLQRGVRIGG